MKIKKILLLLLLFPFVSWGQVLDDPSNDENTVINDTALVLQLPSLSTDYYYSLVLDHNYDYQLYNKYRLTQLFGGEMWLFIGGLLVGCGLGGMMGFIGDEKGWSLGTTLGLSLGVMTVVVVPSSIFGAKLLKKANQDVIKSLELSLVHYELRSPCLLSISSMSNSPFPKNFNLGVGISLSF